MLDRRSAEVLINIMNQQDYITARELSTLMKVSERAIRYDFNKIDIFLEENNIPSLSKVNNKGVKFTGSKQDKENVFLNVCSLNEIEYIFTQEERIYIILDTFITEIAFVTTDVLADKLNTSNSTVKKDLKFVKEYFEGQSVKVSFTQRYGLKLEGNERKIRDSAALMYSDVIQYILRTLEFTNEDVNEIGFKLIQKKIVNIDTIKNIQNEIGKLERKLNLHFSDIYNIKLISHIYATIKRITNNFRIRNYSESEIVSIIKTTEFQLISQMCNDLEGKFNVIFNTFDKVYITQYVLGGSYLRSNKKDDSNNLIYHQLLVRNFINKVQEYIPRKISVDNKLYESLLFHIVPLINRLKYGIDIKNPIINDIKHNYKELFQIVKKASSTIEEGYEKNISENELGYLTIHFAAAIERIKNEENTPVKVILVCHTGYGTSELLSLQLSSMYYVEIVNVVSFKDLKTLTIKDDEIIVSTINIDENFNNEIIIVNPILREIDKIELDKYLIRIEKASVDVKKIVNIVKRSCTIHDYPKLIRELKNINNVRDINYEESESVIMLSDIIFKETIELNVDVKNWEEAVKKGGLLLKNSDIIEDDYIQAMIDTVKNIGPYIVIEEGIAMPHARPEMGAKKIGASLITLKNPVNFGNEENDPVHVVICFASIDSSSHLKALSDLMVLFEDEQAINKIINTNDKDEVLEIIEEISLNN